MWLSFGHALEAATQKLNFDLAAILFQADTQSDVLEGFSLAGTSGLGEILFWSVFIGWLIAE